MEEEDLSWARMSCVKGWVWHFNINDIRMINSQVLRGELFNLEVGVGAVWGDLVLYFFDTDPWDEDDLRKVRGLGFSESFIDFVQWCGEQEVEIFMIGEAFDESIFGDL